MKAPDKIYVRDFGNSLCKMWTYEKWKKKDDVDLVYIRKDALLEWAKEIADNASWMSVDALLNKIESL